MLTPKSSLINTLRQGAAMVSEDFMVDGRPDEIITIREKLWCICLTPMPLYSDAQVGRIQYCLPAVICWEWLQDQWSWSSWRYFFYHNKQNGDNVAILWLLGTLATGFIFICFSIEKRSSCSIFTSTSIAVMVLFTCVSHIDDTSIPWIQAINM